MTQAQVAARLGIDLRSYVSWEQDGTTPLARHHPAIVAFLGYRPAESPLTIAEQIATKRRELGMTIAVAARLLGVDGGTFAGWEGGKHHPLLSGEKVARFLNASSSDDLRASRAVEVCTDKDPRRP